MDINLEYLIHNKVDSGIVIQKDAMELFFMLL
jgi:hypothetical protein